jgi:hypothetical protein
MALTKGTPPVSEISRIRSPEERNICRQLSKVRRYLDKSMSPSIRTMWEGRIATYETQLAKAEVRAGVIK